MSPPTPDFQTPGSSPSPTSQHAASFFPNDFSTPPSRFVPVTDKIESYSPPSCSYPLAYHLRSASPEPFHFNARSSDEEFTRVALAYGEEKGLKHDRSRLDSGVTGVFTTKRFRAGSFVCKYQGEEISVDLYEDWIACRPSRNRHCFLVERQCKRDSFVIDANDFPHKISYGRTIRKSHDKEQCNIKPCVRYIQQGEHRGKSIVYFQALRDIEMWEELVSSYADNQKN